MVMKNFLRRIFSEEKVSDYSKILQEKLQRHKEENEKLEQELKEENEKLKQEIEDLKQEIKKKGLTNEVNKAIKEIEIIKVILANELKREKGLKNTVPKKRLSEFFSTSLYMYSKQLSQLTRALLILTTILIILAIIQIIIVLT